ncbi:hypothetical protein D1BOALGB6SA_10045 [Olavius sp. associated proteobacterium Delta 1]|nr:hypothetical protein D1BOALGB6SA_10045 [Olavius sp. associated proteobacterium Delta 1]
MGISINNKQDSDPLNWEADYILSYRISRIKDLLPGLTIPDTLFDK